MIGQKARLKGGKRVGTITGYVEWGMPSSPERLRVEYVWICFDENVEEFVEIKKCHII
jgi:hypothetical protein